MSKRLARTLKKAERQADKIPMKDRPVVARTPIGEMRRPAPAAKNEGTQ